MDLGIGGSGAVASVCFSAIVAATWRSNQPPMSKQLAHGSLRLEAKLHLKLCVS
jgi:hypothetical protein